MTGFKPAPLASLDAVLAAALEDAAQTPLDLRLQSVSMGRFNNHDLGYYWGAVYAQTHGNTVCDDRPDTSINRIGLIVKEYSETRGRLDDNTD